MAPQTGRFLGILDLETEFPPIATLPAVGSMLNSDSYDLPVITEVVAGGRVEAVMRGDPELEPAFIAAAQRLVERGAVAITSYCGAAIRYQAALAAAVDVPVLTSSLMMVPLLLKQLPPKKKLAVLTFDSRSFNRDWLGLDSSESHDRVIVGGVEGGTLSENERMYPPLRTETTDIELDISRTVARLRKDNPDIGALLFSCTLFPPATPKIRQMAELPVYDITTLCRTTLQSLDNSETRQ
ncbi:hypothetical protein C7I87_29805 [Mesorhizobium sp. SARCC-RB16n]|uniref:hypothetical protein n=1 Tax=Mesorhizobium sp. SARCC-RB16n TaxID=2116687 RepID=UPI00122F0E55|nr:hypothetical protein [Mesorhizobium sp. SARCC-RB16n]KAA3446915.1 hypothetical protein C7I87_29805 [Mesorhizobium sp. SARCC-RB16n]